MAAPQTPEPDATWWAEIEESLGHVDIADQYRAAGVAPFGPGGDELVLHPAGSDPRPVTGNPLSEIRRQLDRLEHLELARIRSALRCIAIGLALQLAATLVAIYALAARP